MCTTIALLTSELPVVLAKRHRLAERVYDRDGLQEYQFHFWQVPAVLPVRRFGQLEILPWGSTIRGGPLPYGHGISVEQIERGVLGGARPEKVVIPANMGMDRGVWYVIAEGIRGVTIETRHGPVVYMLLQPSTNYYRNLAEQSPLEPVLINQVI